MGTIRDKFQKAFGTKADIRAAIIEKGQAVAETDPFAQYPNKIRAIQTGSAEKPVITVDDSGVITATVGDKVSQLPQLTQGIQTIYPDVVDKVIPAGRFLTGNQTVKGDPQLVPANIRKGVSLFGGRIPGELEQETPAISVSSGGLITASAGGKSDTYQLPTKSGSTITPGKTVKTAVAKGLFTVGTVQVQGDPYLDGKYIKSGVSIFGVPGTYKAVSQVIGFGEDLVVNRQNDQPLTDSYRTCTFSFRIGVGGNFTDSSAITTDPNFAGIAYLTLYVSEPMGSYEPSLITINYPPLDPNATVFKQAWRDGYLCAGTATRRTSLVYNSATEYLTVTNLDAHSDLFDFVVKLPSGYTFSQQEYMWPEMIGVYVRG